MTIHNVYSTTHGVEILSAIGSWMFRNSAWRDENISTGKPFPRPPYPPTGSLIRDPGRLRGIPGRSGSARCCDSEKPRFSRFPSSNFSRDLISAETHICTGFDQVRAGWVAHPQTRTHYSESASILTPSSSEDISCAGGPDATLNRGLTRDGPSNESSPTYDPLPAPSEQTGEVR